MTRINTSQLGAAVDAAKGASGSGGSGDLMSEILKLQAKINDNPQLRAQVRSLLEANDLDPSAFGIAGEPTPAPVAGEDVEQGAAPDRITADQFLELIEDFERKVGGEITISQVRTFGEANPAQIQDLLDEYLNVDPDPESSADPDPNGEDDGTQI